MTSSTDLSGFTFDPADGTTVLEPDNSGEGSWVGAPHAWFDETRGTTLLVYRRRNPRDGSPSERGYRLVVAESEDGASFRDLWSVDKFELQTRSIERGSILRTPDGTYRLYLSYEDPADNHWRIDVLEASSPDGFDIATRREVLTAAGTGRDAVKDPFVFVEDGRYVMLVSTFHTAQGPAPTHLATSDDGLRFEFDQQPALDVGEGWDRYQARLNSVVALRDGYLGWYDGAASAAEDTEERCGLAVSDDLRTWRSITPDGPVLVSTHGTGSLRYVTPVDRGDERWLYYEWTRPDGSHELRVNRVPTVANLPEPARAKSAG